LQPRFNQLYESRLVERFRQGDAQALSALFEMHADRIYAYARHILGNREDAEEVASEAFIRAFRHAIDFRGEGSFKGWLFTIVRNLCRDRQRQPRLLIVPPDLLTEINPAEDSYGRQEIRADVRAAMQELSEEYQDVLILCDVEQWDAREVAETLNRSLASTKSLLYRARRALRDRLNERWTEE